MLILTLENTLDDYIEIGKDVRIYSLPSERKGKVKIGIDAPKNVIIRRKKVIEREELTKKGNQND